MSYYDLNKEYIKRRLNEFKDYFYLKHHNSFAFYQAPLSIISKYDDALIPNLQNGALAFNIDKTGESFKSNL